MKYFFASLGVVGLTIVLAGCSWFVKDGQTNLPGIDVQRNVANTVVDDENSDGNIDPEPAAEKGFKKLHRPDHGFELTYPDDVTVQETTTCVEGCPEGESKPAFSFDIDSGGSVKLVMYTNEEEFLRYLDPLAEDFASFIETDTPTNTSSKEVSGGTRYDLVIPGFSGQPGLYGPEGLPEMQYTVFVRNGGKSFVLSAGTHDERPLQTLSKMAASFKFI
jgi:hypothetical protein